MIEVQKFVELLDSEFFTGVPDSQLNSLCSFLLDEYGTDPTRHIIAANEGNCVGIAAGYHLATGKIPTVYLQNSGQGNIINPVLSLSKIYDLPVKFVIGWRGEPGIKDEPQHLYQGQITLKLLEDLGIDYVVVKNSTSIDEIRAHEFTSKQIAFVICKGSLTYEKRSYESSGFLRESAIEKIVEFAKNDVIVSTTGKTSRELFEIREKLNQTHEHDFLTVGSMGHTSSIALGIAIQRPDKRVWCIDGDGSFLMHMGSSAIIGSIKPKNLVHIVINNGAHESVGGMPTVAKKINLQLIAEGCGYEKIFRAHNEVELTQILDKISDSLTFLEIECAIKSRKDLGRPTLDPVDNKKSFMQNLTSLHR